jgi:DNA-binding MarR family transcriptional regulator
VPRKEFINLIEQNLLILDWLSGQLKNAPRFSGEYSHQQLKVLGRLFIGGRARLKDIAAREFIPVSNLCSIFRRLEQDGLIVREVDPDDRRNTWYSVSDAGAALATRALEGFRAHIAELFSGIGREEAAELTAALKKLNEALNKIKVSKL